MDAVHIISQILGILAFIMTVICYQFNTQKKILLMQLVCSLLFLANLILNGSYSGALMNVLGFCRCLVFYQRGKHKWADSPWVCVIFCVLAVVCGIVTYSSPVDILPAVGMIFTGISLYMTNPKLIRLFTLPSPPCWFVYHLTASGSVNIGGVLNEVFVTVSVIVAMIRYGDFKKNAAGVDTVPAEEVTKNA